MSWKKKLEKRLQKYPILHDWIMLAYLSLGNKKSEKVPEPTLKQVYSSVWIENTNACNLNCITCDTKLSKRPVGYMKIELYEKIIRELKKIGVKKVALHTVGEPFVHKEFNDHLRIAYENGIGIVLSTNGQILTEQHIESLLKYPPIQIRYSVDGATKETYEKIRRGGKFERLIKNMEKLSDAMEKAGVKIPVRIGSMILEDNIEELSMFYDVFRKFVRDSSYIDFKMPNTLSATDAKDYFGDFGTTITPRIPCGLLWSSIAILYDGRISACCRDYHGELIMGNILEQSLSEIWNGKRYKEVRRKHLSGNVSDVPMCKNCFRSASPREAKKISIALHLVQKSKLRFLNRIIAKAFLPPPLRRTIKGK
ncbi:MAG: radical SAM protein [Candidatus Aureabacteria bacterium]|nr:radical SAM protein [Candidatus Auribacterota bacterium]